MANTSITHITALIAWSAFACSAVGQEASPLAPRLFPAPTGRNGAEELAAAADLIATSTPFSTAIEPGALLSQKRAALDDPRIVQALMLARKGLSKQVASAHSFSDKMDYSIYAAYRSVARLLGVACYVELEGGDGRSAIQTLREGLTLARTVQADSVLGALVGGAIVAVVATPMEKNVQRLSESECRLLHRLAADWMNLESPAVAMMDGERRFSLQALNEQLAELPAADRSEALGLMANRFEQLKTIVKTPPHLRKPLPPITGESVAARIVAALDLKAIEQSLPRFTQHMARVQMLGVRAAIEQYRWEHNGQPPGTLGELGLRGMELDPFTGKPFTYVRVSDSAYTLMAADPPPVVNVKSD